MPLVTLSRGPVQDVEQLAERQRRLYTAATRPTERLIIAGTEETIRAALARPAARASALRGRLWGES